MQLSLIGSFGSMMIRRLYHPETKTCNIVRIEKWIDASFVPERVGTSFVLGGRACLTHLSWYFNTKVCMIQAASGTRNCQFSGSFSYHHDIPCFGSTASKTFRLDDDELPRTLIRCKPDKHATEAVSPRQTDYYESSRALGLLYRSITLDDPNPIPSVPPVQPLSDPIKLTLLEAVQLYLGNFAIVGNPAELEIEKPCGWVVIYRCNSHFFEYARCQSIGNCVTLGKKKKRRNVVWILTLLMILCYFGVNIIVTVLWMKNRRSFCRACVCII